MATFEEKQKSTIPGVPVVGTPVIRRRQPMAKTTNDPEAQAEAQGKAAEAHAKALEKRGEKPQELRSRGDATETSDEPTGGGAGDKKATAKGKK